MVSGRVCLTARCANMQVIFHDRPSTSVNLVMRMKYPSFITSTDRVALDPQKTESIFLRTITGTA